MHHQRGAVYALRLLCPLMLLAALKVTHFAYVRGVRRSTFCSGASATTYCAVIYGLRRWRMEELPLHVAFMWNVRLTTTTTTTSVDVVGKQLIFASSPYQHIEAEWSRAAAAANLYVLATANRHNVCVVCVCNTHECVFLHVCARQSFVSQRKARGAHQFATALPIYGWLSVCICEYMCLSKTYP